MVKAKTLVIAPALPGKPLSGGGQCLLRAVEAGYFPDLALTGQADKEFARAATEIKNALGVALPQPPDHRVQPFTMQ
jgi:hypothetical protein